MNDTYLSKQKQDCSGLRPQSSTTKHQQQNSTSMHHFRGEAEENSTERLRQQNSTFKEKSQQLESLSLSMSGTGLSRQSINKRQSFQNQSNLQSRLANKSQRNSISLSFQINLQNASSHLREEQQQSL